MAVQFKSMYPSVRLHRAAWICLPMLAVFSLLASSVLAQDDKKTPSLEDYPKVVAVVNGNTITRDKLAQECMRRYAPIVLDNLLNKQLILQACQAKNITITVADVNQEIANTAAKFGITPSMFLENLEKERDITSGQYSAEIVWPMLALRALAAEKISVSPQEVEEVIQSEYGEKVQVRLIACSTFEKAQRLHAEVSAKPETFGRLAKEHSEEAVSASVDGLLPPIRRFSGDDKLENVAFQLQANEISPVFQVGELHIILKHERNLPASMPNPQALPLIQTRIHDQIRDKRLGEAADEIFSSLQQNSQVVTVIGNPEYEAKYPGVAAYINRQPVPLSRLAYECVARHGRTILRGEIDRLLLSKALEATNKTVTQQDIDLEVARAADMAGYIDSSGTPDTKAWLESIMQEEGVTMDLYIDDAVWPSVALKKLVEDEIVISDEDLQKGFESNFGPRADVLAIVLSNQRTAQDVFRKARESLNEQTFGALAAEFSVEPVSRMNYGKIPALRRWGGRPTLEDAAFGLKTGEMSGVLAWGDQYAILYKQGETEPLIQDIEAVRPEIEKEIREKKIRVAMRRKLDELQRAAQIDNLIEGTTQSGASTPATARAATPKTNR